jgi:hypothetical protein
LYRSFYENEQEEENMFQEEKEDMFQGKNLGINDESDFPEGELDDSALRH